MMEPWPSSSAMPPTSDMRTRLLEARELVEIDRIIGGEV